MTNASKSHAHSEIHVNSIWYEPSTLN